MSKALVAGGGGFIGGHLAARLLAEGREVRCVDVKSVPTWYQIHSDAENLELDLTDLDACRKAVNGVDEVYNLAADMGGMGFIENNKAACMLSVLISTHLLMAVNELDIERLFYASSACVYNGSRQTDPAVTALRESDAYPADPEDGYGWEKLFSERMGRHFMEDFGLRFRTARYHNVYGPYGTWDGGREKAPAAICRKIAAARQAGDNEIEVWGDGMQTRSFMYIDDCVEGTLRLMASDVVDPINLGSSELVTINQLTDLVADIAGITIGRRHVLDAPQGVRGRNSDNEMIRARLDWEPGVSLRHGMTVTFEWINDHMNRANALRS